MNYFKSLKMANSKQLKIFALNVNSIATCNRRLLLTEFIGNTGGDIYLISETKLGNENHFGFLNYNVFRCDRKKGAGGVAILFKNKFKFKNTKKHTGTIECISVDLLIDNVWINFISSYFNNSIKENDLIKIIKQNKPFLMGGDMNSRHICR